MNEDFDITIIGGGAAGIGAARALAESGLNTLLLEALPRLGGRARTTSAAGLALDLGCGWLHSADRNPWALIAEEAGVDIDRSPGAWEKQYQDRGFPAAEQAAARRAFADWGERIVNTPPASDRASDMLADVPRWAAYLQAMSGFVSGDELERVSARDYGAYENASSFVNWRLPAGYGTLISASLPQTAGLRLATPVEALRLDGCRVVIETPAGAIGSRAVILTVSTHVLAGDRIRMPAALDPWREAASRVPLGNNEKLFLEIIGETAFAPESHVIGDPHDPETGAYYIRPFGWPVIECYLGGAGARAAHKKGRAAAFAHAIEQIVRLFGAEVRAHLRPLVASNWTGSPTIGGAYSHALSGQADARLELARPFDGRVFFAGEATHVCDFSTAHGAYESGVRAAGEALLALTSQPTSGAVSTR